MTWSLNDLAGLCRLLGIKVLRRTNPKLSVFLRRDGDYDPLRKEV